MRKRTKIVIGVAVIILGTVGWFFYDMRKSSPTVIPKYDVNFFYGRECPHCQDVESFLQKNKINEKINFDSIEVWHNKTNEEELLKKAKECGLGNDGIAVPFLYANGKCFVGTQLVEDFFKNFGNE